MQGSGIRDQGSGKLIGPALILLAAAIAVAPLALRGISCGHDFDFHLASWIDALGAWRHGIFYPHWTPSVNYEAGEPRFIFYPPLTWMLGAALGALLGWQATPIAVPFVLLAAEGLAVRALARKFMDSNAAALAGCIAIFSGYALFCVYERSDYAELAGGFWIPLVLLYALRERGTDAAQLSVWRRAFDGSALLLALAIAGSWLSNDPVGVMASYLLAAFALLLALARRSWAPVLRASAGVVLGLGLSAFYLVPAAVEQKWADVGAAVDVPGLRVDTSFLFAHHADPALALHDVELQKTSLIVVVMFALAAGALLVCRLRRKMPGPRRLWLPLIAILAAILFLQFPVSLPVWHLLPKLWFLQFPWRWALVVEAPVGIFAACAIWTRAGWRRWALIAACAAVFAGEAWFAGTHFYLPCDDEDSVAGMMDAYAQQQGFDGADEYAPPETDEDLTTEGLPVACLASDPEVKVGESNEDSPPLVWSPDQKSCEDFHGAATGSVEHRQIRGVAARAGYLVLRLRQFPAWDVRVNGERIDEMPQRDDGLMAVPVQAGFVDVTVDWTTTPDVRLGGWISVFALIAAVGLWVVERGKTKASR